ncbi:MAG: carbamoyltransferase, partial [Alphaproteobacteria bacterium]|nr:carbamoyltransferase [Alphaproteobacteria bacterium]
RSILCDPRRADARDLLNLRIKRREPFRPFAPSVLAESFADWFDADGPLPHMTHVVPLRSERRAAVPAVVHQDGTGRPQTVSADTDPLFHRLIAAFAARTGVPMLLNTSFNENEPIVTTPDEALACFLRTRMDALALGPHLLRRPEPPGRDAP